MGNIREIRGYMEPDYTAFKEMFGEYFLNDFNIELTEKELENICREITQKVKENILFLDLLMLNNSAKGFIIYQIDSPSSDWCEKEGYGFIRELFIAADFRKKGYGKDLAVYAENKLWDLSVPYIYLTAYESKNFWIKTGYQDSGEVSAKNDDRIYIK